jgi:predicted nucleotidyltransferase
MSKLKIKIPSRLIEEFCMKWNITEFALFGSVLRDDFNPDSDIDVLVTFDHIAKTTLFDLARMQKELEEIFGRHVDILSRRGVESGRNKRRRDAILNSAVVVYGAR